MLQELTMEEIEIVSGGDDVTEILDGVIGAGSGVAAVGGGLAMEAGLAAGLVIGGGAVVAVGGVALIGYGIYQMV